MKKLLLLAFVLMGCGGKLSDEERKKLHDGMSALDIKRVSEADLQNAGIAYAQSVMTDIERVDSRLANVNITDSIALARGVRIYKLIPTDSALREIEKQLVEAYVAGGNAQTAGENLQKVGLDSLLFTKPVFKSNSDGSQQFDYAIGIKMSTKTVVLSMPKP